jgi:hypothetical protein
MVRPEGSLRLPAAKTFSSAAETEDAANAIMEATSKERIEISIVIPGRAKREPGMTL